MKFVILFICAVISADGAYEGELCDLKAEVGTCKKIKNCPTAIEDIRKGVRPPTCGFDNDDVIVCCRNTQNVLTTTKRYRQCFDSSGESSSGCECAHSSRARFVKYNIFTSRVSTTTEYIPQEYVYEDVGNKQGGCEPIPPIMTSKPTGQKAWDKCIEYQEKYVFPCEKGVALTGELGRVNRCHHNADELIIGGTAAAQFEFPHMVLLGYQDDQQGKIDYECGGTLISERYVLTAGHCTSNRLRNKVSHALVGIVRRSEESNENRFGVKRILAHKDYQSPGKYNDIALLELDRDVPLSHAVVPACLHTGDSVDESRASATGWGDTVYNKVNSKVDVLQKVVLTKFTLNECSEKYEANRNMLNGVDDSSQVCYGDRTKSKDTCQGDSGGPLQVKNKKIVCMYTVVGVTSFGQACGWAGVPGIYTRVAKYLPWIESVVWPN